MKKSTENYPEKFTQESKRIVSNFLNELENTGLGARLLMPNRKITTSEYNKLKLFPGPAQRESMIFDLYADIRKKNVLQIFAYFVLKIKSAGKKTFKGVDQKYFYEHWYIKFIEHNISRYIYGKGYSAKAHAGWIIKQLSSRADKYHTVAYMNELSAIWRRGGLGKEFKEYVRVELATNGYSVSDYGILGQ